MNQLTMKIMNLNLKDQIYRHYFSLEQYQTGLAKLLVLLLHNQTKKKVIKATRLINFLFLNINLINNLALVLHQD